ncbi:MAG: bifunctional oligoribonuclease/PAP phosphatase NrnA [Planctomycetota bacterium]|nr:bifunctional oligoribonuclease/PAP phosphatase NrnA [Planctomycetota bacterium]
MAVSPAAACMRAILKARDVLVVAHERPDPDCYGTQIALVCALRDRVPRIHAISHSPPPLRFPREAGVWVVESYRPGRILSADCIVAVDTADLSRLGSMANDLPRGVPIVNIDHHPSNTMFGTVNWVDPRASSVGEMVYLMLKQAKIPIPPEAVRALYAAIVSDTGRFSYSNTTPGAMRAAAELIESGASPEATWLGLYMNRSMAEIELENRARASLETRLGGSVAAISLSAADFRELGLGPEATQEFATIPLTLKDVAIAIYFYEIDGGRRTKVSLRSVGRIRVDRLAMRFGGGGHEKAAGCVLDGPLAAAKRAFLRAVGRHLVSEIIPGPAQDRNAARGGDGAEKRPDGEARERGGAGHVRKKRGG